MVCFLRTPHFSGNKFQWARFHNGTCIFLSLFARNMQILSCTNHAFLFLSFFFFLLLFSNMKNGNEVVVQMLPRKLLGLIVHGLYLLHNNVYSIECI